MYQTEREFDVSEIFDYDLLTKRARELEPLLRPRAVHAGFKLNSRCPSDHIAIIRNESSVPKREKQNLIIENIFAALAIFSLALVLFQISQSSLLANAVTLAVICCAVRGLPVCRT
jgi:hypothetical protein